MSRRRSVLARRASAPLALLRRTIERHVGAASAIKLKDLVVVLGLRGFSDPARAIRDGINELIALGVPIGSITAEGPRGGNSGYFIVASEDELRECVGQLRRRIEKTERHVEQLITAYRHGPRQPGLFEVDTPAVTLTTTPTVASGVARPRDRERFVPPVRQFIDEQLSRAPSGDVARQTQPGAR